MSQPKNTSNKVQFMMNLNRKTFKEFKKMCLDFDVTPSEAMRNLVQNSLRSGEIPYIETPENYVKFMPSGTAEQDEMDYKY